jgi:hypothetical protein
VAYRHLRKADTTRLLRDMEKTLGDYYMHTLAYKVLRLHQRFHFLLLLLLLLLPSIYSSLNAPV